MKKANDSGNGHRVGLGLGIATLAAGAAGYYFLYGSKKAARNRLKVKSWMLRMKAEVMDEVENLKEVTEDTYDAVVDKISEKYEQVKEIDPKEVRALAGRMKDHWHDIRNDIGEVASGKGGSGKKSRSNRDS
jgi:hypothetical protein